MPAHSFPRNEGDMELTGKTLFFSLDGWVWSFNFVIAMPESKIHY
jgi:hypothetical protein